MDSDLVSGSLSTEDGEGKSSSSFFTYTEQFYQQFPYYLSIGMTAEQYWDSDPMLAKYYREAEGLRSERRNQELWLQGMYIYEALCDVSPLLRAFPKKGTKPEPYAAKPYAITEKQRRVEAEAKERKVAEKGKLFMENLMRSINAQMKEKEEGGA